MAGMGSNVRPVAATKGWGRASQADGKWEGGGNMGAGGCQSGAGRPVGSLVEWDGFPRPRHSPDLLKEGRELQQDPR